MSASTTPGFEAASHAHDTLAAELAALEPGDLIRVNVDMGRAVSRVLAVAPRVRELAPELERALGQPPDPRILRLEVYALAAWYAHSSTWRIKSTSNTKELMAAARPLRARLLAAANAFAHGGFVDPLRVARIRANRGRVDMAKDLIALSALLREAWPKIAATTVVTQRDIEEASTLGTELMQALAHGDQAVEAQRALLRERCSRAFTLLIRVYREAERVVSFTRWQQGDAKSILPSLFDQGGGRPRTPKTAGATSSPPPGTNDSSEEAPTPSR